MIEKIRESIKDIEFYNSINDLFINNSLNKLVIIAKSMIMKSFPNKWMSNKIKRHLCVKTMKAHILLAQLVKECK